MECGPVGGIVRWCCGNTSGARGGTNGFGTHTKAADDDGSEGDDHGQGKEQCGVRAGEVEASLRYDETRLGRASLGVLVSPCPRVSVSPDLANHADDCSSSS